MARKIFNKKVFAILTSIVMMLSLFSLVTVAQDTYKIGDVVYTANEDTRPTGTIPANAEWKCMGMTKVEYGCGYTAHEHYRSFTGIGDCYDIFGDLSCKKEEHTHDNTCIKTPSQAKWQVVENTDSAIHLDIHIGLTAIYTVNGQSYQTKVTLTEQDYTSGNLTITTPGDIHNITGTDIYDAGQRRFYGDFPVGTYENPVNYTITLTKAATFNVNGEEVTVPMTFSRTINYWTQDNVCESLTGHRNYRNWSKGEFLSNTGMDFALGTSTATQTPDTPDTPVKIILTVQKDLSGITFNTNQTFTFGVYNTEGEKVEAVNVIVPAGASTALATVAIEEGTYYVAEEGNYSVEGYTLTTSSVTAGTASAEGTTSSTTQMGADTSVVFTNAYETVSIPEPPEPPVIPTYNYSVVYNANFGANPASFTDTETVADVTDTAYDITVDGNMFSRSGYNFLRWEDLEGNTYQESDVVSLTAENNIKVLYAVWEIIPTYNYTLTYNANFGETPETLDDSENILGTTLTATRFTVDENTFEREGYIFLRWEDENGTAYAENAKADLTAENNALTLYAIWEKEEEVVYYNYTLTYNANFGETPETLADEENTAGTAAATLQMTVDSNTFEREGYIFLRWEDENGTAYAEGSQANLTAENNTLTLYAIWEKEEEVVYFDYRLIYNANFGDNPEIRADSENTYATPNTLWVFGIDSNTFEREDYTFGCWNTRPDGTGTDYYPGEIMALDTDLRNVELYAMWAQNDEPTVIDLDPPTEDDGDENGGEEDLTDLEDEDVPLADVPVTADPMVIFVAMSLLSGLGLVVLGKKKF